MGLKGTHFANPNGLDHPDHYSTARDLAELSCYAMENPIFAKTVSTKTIRIGDRFLRNHNKLLWQVEGADGVKTGFTKSAGRTLVSSASRQGRRVVAVTLDAPDDWRDHGSLLNEGFAQYQIKRVVSKGDKVAARTVIGGNGTVDLIADGDFDYALAPSDRPQTAAGGQHFVYAPVTEGANAGTGYILISGRIVGRVPLVYGETVEQTPIKKRAWWKPGG